MKSAVTLALLTSISLASFLWLRPIIGELGVPEPPAAIGSHAASAVSSSASTPELETPEPSAGPPITVSHLSDVEDIVFELTNNERSKNKLPPLQKESVLTETAQAHCDDMIRRDFFRHDNPDGLEAGDRVAAAHRRLVGFVGENIWMSRGPNPSDSRQVAERIILDWMGSPEHRDSILKPEFTHLGVGISQGGDVINATQNFATVRAYLSTDLPDEIRRGDRINLQTQPPIPLTELKRSPASRIEPAAPVKYGFWVKEKGKITYGPCSMSQNTVDAPSGVYKLHLYFSDRPGNLSWFPGPQLKVN